MSLVLFYRTLIIVEILLVVLFGVLSGTMTAHHSEDWQTLLEWNGDGDIWDSLLPSEPSLLGSITVLSVSGGLVLVIVWNIIGTFLFWPSSRWVYLALSIISFLLTSIGGILVITPWALLTYDLGNYVAGILLALMFFSPLATRFQKRPKPTAEPPLS